VRAPARASGDDSYIIQPPSGYCSIQLPFFGIFGRSRVSGIKAEKPKNGS